MINTSLDIKQLSEEFAQNKSVQIFDFLKEKDANNLFNWFYDDIPEDWWFTSIHNPREKDYKGANNLQNNEKNKEIIEQKISEANEAFINGNFSYVFDRSLPHAANCTCFECQFVEFLNSDYMLFFLKAVTGVKADHTNEVFASRFKPNQFLSPHHDEGKGKIGFVYSLSKGWRPEWGGNLHFMKEDYRTVVKTIVPKFNRLTLFDIPSRDGIPHYVSHVLANAPMNRISITGWFN
tara:strand:+ start:805 stop:1512 length:708 start_codon:yes stop_codon:yes gene_type:complete